MSRIDALIAERCPEGVRNAISPNLLSLGSMTR